MSRLFDQYHGEVMDTLMERFGYKNRLAVPRLEKIVISMGVGRANEEPKLVETAAADLSTISGQKAVLTRARKSVSNFRLREGYVVGCMVTLRGSRMYEFLDRLTSIVIPRIRDFRGLKTTSFDHAGNYSMGLTDQLMFPEIKTDRVQNTQGMNVTLTIKKSNPEASLALLRLMGMPFKTD